MRLDLSAYRISLVICPVDMRRGFRSLSALAMSLLNIDVSQCRDCVVFGSSRRTVCKTIWADAHGAAMLSRSLNQGRFNQLLEQSELRHKISLNELMNFLDGGSIWRGEKAK